MQDEENIGKYKSTLSHCARDCGVHFESWLGKDGKTLEWTSLRFSDKKKLLVSLPEKFHLFLEDADVEPTIKLWKVIANYVIYVSMYRFKSFVL